MCRWVDKRNWPASEPGSQSSWGIADRNINGAWAPGPNLLLSLWLQILKCFNGYGWVRGHCSLKNLLSLFTPSWSSLTYSSSHFALSLPETPSNKIKQTNKTHKFDNSSQKWFCLFRNGQQKSYKEQNNDSWISKPHELGWCKPRAWLGSASFTGKKPPNKSQNRTTFSPLFSEIEERSVSQICINFKGIKDK